MLNLTQHPATPDQLHAGVVDLEGQALETLKGLITFDEMPTVEDIRARAEAVADIALALGATRVMIGGAQWLTRPLCEALENQGIAPYFSFSKREVIETPNADGSVTKSHVFRHEGFLLAP